MSRTCGSLIRACGVHLARHQVQGPVRFPVHEDHRDSRTRQQGQRPLHVRRHCRRHIWYVTVWLPAAAHGACLPRRRSGTRYLSKVMRLLRAPGRQGSPSITSLRLETASVRQPERFASACCSSAVTVPLLERCSNALGGLRVASEGYSMLQSDPDRVGTSLCVIVTFHAPSALPKPR